LGQPVVVGDQAVEIIAKSEGRSKVEGVKWAQGRRLQPSGRLVNRCVDGDQSDGVQHRSGLDGSAWNRPSHRPEQLGAREVARHNYAVIRD
jgi:hypothetical protein